MGSVNGTGKLASFLREEWFLLFAAATAVACFVFPDLVSDALQDPYWLTFVFVWMFTTVLGAAVGVVHHADKLAALLGEPYGTLILTLSVTIIEVVSISAVMTHGENNPTLGRDTLFAVIMIILNGMVGLSLLIGGWRHREQHHNLQGANVYLGVIIPLAALNLILPNFTQTTPGPTLSLAQQIFVGTVSIGLYAAFVAMQTGRYRGYFMLDDEKLHAPAKARVNSSATERGPVLPHALLLLCYLAPALYLAEHLARPVDYLIETLHAPAALGGVIMAVLVATPEAIGAVRAAMANKLQRSVNIFLGSVLSTIGLTVPAMVLISQFTNHPIVLGLEHTDLVMLMLTLVVSIVTFSSGRTNVMQGAVHLILFASYVMLIVQN